MTKYLGKFRDEDGEPFTVYDIIGQVAYLLMGPEGYFTQAPLSMVQKMVDKGIWRRVKK